MSLLICASVVFCYSLLPPRPIDPEPVTVWDRSEPAGGYTELLEMVIWEHGLEPHWAWNDMLPWDPVRFRWSIVEVLGWTMWCESHLTPRASGDFRWKDGIQVPWSRGLWQIHSGYNPAVAIWQARDPAWSTRWALAHLLHGRAHYWSCWRSLQ